MSDRAPKEARPAGIDDLKLLLRALHEYGVDYLLIGGYALYALGFLVRGEYRGETPYGLMTAPYRRVIVTHLAIILGGFATLLLDTPLLALVLLVVLKIGADLHAHRREHAPVRAAGIHR